jgi:hypothetical protein
VQELTFASFTARNTFPNNVLLLKGGELVTFDTAVQNDQLDFTITGRVLKKEQFEDVEGVFTFLFDRWKPEKKVFKASEVKAKCSLAPLTTQKKFMGSSVSESSGITWMAISMIN